MSAGEVRRSGYRWPRWEVYYPPQPEGGMGTHTLHMTKVGARISRWLNA